MSEEMNLYKRCKNIFKFHGVDMGGGGGESAPEVENAIETHGLGWTDEEEVEGFDIQWDGNTEGLESLWDGLLFKVDSNLHGITSAEDLIGSTLFAIGYGQEMRQDITEENVKVEADELLSVLSGYVMVALSDLTVEGTRVSKGIWFTGGEEGDHVYRFYKEATTEEVVHQIDQKYIPGGSGGGGGGLVVNLTGDDEETWASDKTFPEIKQALENGQFIVVKFSVNGKNYIVSGGTLLPGETEDYEGIQFMLGASGGAINCVGNADEISWSMG